MDLRLPEAYAPGLTLFNIYIKERTLLEVIFKYIYTVCR